MAAVWLSLLRMLAPHAAGLLGPAGGSGRLCRCALPHGLEHGFPKILEPEDQLQVHTAGLHHLGRKGDLVRQRLHTWAQFGVFPPQ